MANDEMQQFPGKWRIPETDEEMEGTLFISEEKNIISLHLIKPYYDLNGDDVPNPLPVSSILARENAAVIKGKINGGATVLLAGCRLGGACTHMPSHSEIWAYCDYLFFGLDVDTSPELVFTKVRIDFGEIINWADMGRFEWDFDSFTERKPLLQWKNHKEEIHFPINEKVSMRIQPRPENGYGMLLNANEIVVHQGVDIILEYLEATAWKRFVLIYKLYETSLHLL